MNPFLNPKSNKLTYSARVRVGCGRCHVVVVFSLLVVYVSIVRATNAEWWCVVYNGLCSSWSCFAKFFLMCHGHLVRENVPMHHPLFCVLGHILHDTFVVYIFFD
ncbi:hypothetical protein PHAVU_005G049500 [Phaseolus vulgaris]|uniref:Transmembrane protein n=1 Tax=Phaseolus vulgaris TaxID=3885 RepID=V7BT68_PHAVU|nr:hypothetical protein PHAVU_005G049500g [Phaseolus vulgaris]ESW21187.1 hypothetical protein PHAVU_005G049500g [Phaseolus vulgaris]